jgi:hypothetical protein
VQEDGSRKDPGIATFDSLNAHGVLENAQDMRHVMRAVIAFRRMRYERGGKLFKWSEGLRLEHGITAWEEGVLP